jgi:hypothetical protein
VATAFLNHPTAPVDTSCVEAMPHVVFETSLGGAAGGHDVEALLREARERCAAPAERSYPPVGGSAFDCSR